MTLGIVQVHMSYQGFHHSSVGKESTCNMGDPSSIPGLRRSIGDGIGYPLQYSWAFLVAQLVKNLPAMWDNWVWSLGWEDPMEKGEATHSSILAWRIPWTVESMWLQRVGHDWVTGTFIFIQVYTHTHTHTHTHTPKTQLMKEIIDKLDFIKN